MKLMRKRILALCMALCLCLSFCAELAGAVDVKQMPEEDGYGPITLTLSLTKSGSDYVATYTAKTTMIDWLAKAAAVCKDDPRMANLRFTCTLRDDLTAQLAGATSDEYTFTSAKYGGEDIFILDLPNAVTVSGGALRLRYKLNPAVLSLWRTETTENVKTALQSEMSMSASKSVPAHTFTWFGQTITSTARIDITTTDPEIPFYHETSIFAAYGECKIQNPGYVSGGGESVVTPPKPVVVEIEDKTPSVTETVPGLPVAGGKTTVDKPNAKPGEEVKITTKSDKGSMVGYISVKDEDGNRVPVTYEGKGKYTFEMPENGKVEIEATYRIIPADPKETGVADLLDTDNHILYLIGDDKGDFRPNASISRAEVATAFFRLLRNQNVPITQHFNDVSAKDWFVKPVETLASIGIINGVGDGSFEPNRAITRAEFATIAARFANKLVSTASFMDVDENAWYADFVSTAASFGWINGVGDGRYEPDRPITRTEAAAIINRMLRRISDWIEVDAGKGRHFPDVDENFWGRYDISEATNGHDHDMEEEYFHEDWIAEDWREAVDNDPVNFGQPIF